MFQAASLLERLPQKAGRVILLLSFINLLLSDIVSTLSSKGYCLNNLQEDVLEQHQA